MMTKSQASVARRLLHNEATNMGPTQQAQLRAACCSSESREERLRAGSLLEGNVDVCDRWGSQKRKAGLSLPNNSKKTVYANSAVHDRCGFLLAMPRLQERATRRKSKNCKERARENNSVTERTKELSRSNPRSTPNHVLRKARLDLPQKPR